MKTLQKFGGFAALYMAAAHLIGIVIFLVVLDYLSITDPAQKVALNVEKQTVVFSTNLLMYVFFGFALIVLSLALYDRLKSGAPATHAGGNRDRDHLGWLADRQRHGRECRARYCCPTLCQRPGPGCVDLAGN